MIAVSTDSSGIIAHLQEQAGIPHKSPRRSNEPAPVPENVTSLELVANFLFDVAARKTDIRRSTRAWELRLGE